MIYALRTFSVVQSPSCVRLFVTLWTSASQASLSFTMLLEFAQVHVHWISGAIQPSHPLLPSSSAFSLSQYQGLSQCISCLHHVAKVLELQHQTFQRVCKVYFFKIDWFDLLAFQGTLKCLFQHHTSKTSILQCSAFFIVQVSHPYVTTGKIIALSAWTFVGKVVSAF